MSRRARFGAWIAAALAAAALIAQLARAPGALDDGPAAHTSSAPAAAEDPTEPGPAALPRPSSDSIAALVPQAETSAAVEALVEPRRWVGGQVVRAADGTPLVGAVVRAVPAAPTPGGTTVDPDGRFKIWPRETTDTLEVSLDRKNTWQPAPQTFPIEPGATDREDLRLEYDTGFTLIGSVVDQDGRPVPAAEVLVRERPPAGADRGVARTDENGRYALQDLSPPPPLQALTVVASASSHVEASQSLALAGDDAAVRTLDFELELGGSIDVFASLPDTLPAEDANAFVVLGASGRRISGFARDDGSIRIAQLPAGEHTVLVCLRADSDWLGSRITLLASTRVDAVVVAAGQTTRLDVLLQPGARLAGRVTDEHGLPLKKADVWLEAVQLPTGYRPADPATPLAVHFAMATETRFVASAGHLRGQTQTDASGAFELVGVPAGAVRVVAKSPGLVRSAIELDLEPGEMRRDVNFELQPGLDVDGRLLLADGSPLPPCTRVLVLPADKESDEVLALVETWMDGEFHADGIAPGPKRLLVVASDGSWIDEPVQPGGAAQTFVTRR